MAMREHIAGNCSSDFALAGNFPFGSCQSQPYASLDKIRDLLQNSASNAVLYTEAYFRVYYPGLPVLNYSAFMSRMESFHDTPELEDFSWLAQYFVVLGLGAYATTIDEVASSEYFYASEACLARTAYMYRPTTTNISTLCLMVLAKVSCICNLLGTRHQLDCYGSCRSLVHNDGITQRLDGWV